MSITTKSSEVTTGNNTSSRKCTTDRRACDILSIAPPRRIPLSVDADNDDYGFVHLPCLLMSCCLWVVGMIKKGS